MFYNRISVVESDLSGSTSITVGSTGYTVIPASRGSEQPLFFGTGSKSQILQLFGKASKAEYKGVWEAIEYNNYRPLWISSPSLNGIYGGAFITKTGTVPFTNGTVDTEIADLSAIPVTESMGTGNGVTTVFTLTLDKADYYTNNSVDILVDDVSITLTGTDTDPEVLTSAPDVGTGSYDRTTGELTFTFDTAPLLDESITTDYLIDMSADTYFVMYNRNPEVDWKSLKVSMNSSNVFSIVAESKENNKYSTLPDSPYKVSLTENFIDEATGLNIDINNVFEDDVYFTAQVNTALDVTTFTDDALRVDLAGGSRGDSITLTELTKGWDYAKNKNTYKADILFDTTADAGIPPLFVTLRANNQQYAHYILPTPNENYADAIATKNGYTLNDRGLSVYWNWGFVEDPNSLAKFYTPLTGPIAVRHALMDDVFNGLSPSMINEGIHGGQLTGVSRIIKMRYDLPDDIIAATLTENRLNGIVRDNTYGFMLLNARTTVSEENDFSFVGHSRCSDWIIDNITKQVLVYQADKLNDTEHRAVVSSKTNNIVSSPAAPPYNLLREYLVKCDEKNNTDTVLKKREFILAVVVKFTTFATKIKLIFTTAAQDVSVEEVIG